MPAVPRVSNVTATRGQLHQLAAFVVGVTAENARHVAHVIFVHADDEVVSVVIIFLELNGALALAGEPVARQFRFCRGIDGVADAVPYLLTAGGGRRNDKFALSASFFNHILEYKLRHRTAADVPVAYEQDPVHNTPSLSLGIL